MLALPKAYTSVVVAMFFVIGCCSSVRVPINFCLMYDSAPKRYHSIMNSIYFVLEIVTFVYQTLHYQNISSSFYGPHIFGLCQAIIGFSLLASLIPESPKWLYEKGKYKECQQVLDKMAKINGTTMTSDIA